MKLLPVHLQHNPDFWVYLEHLVSAAPVVIDRPRGSVHPRYPEQIYPVDYGYLAGTTAVDGDGVDLWRGSLEKPVLDGIFITADIGKQDVEVKLLLGCTPNEVLAAYDFLTAEGMRALYLPRPTDARSQTGPLVVELASQPMDNLEGQALHRALRARRSVRRFRPLPVPPVVLQRILESACRAPSAHNSQPWRFVLLETLDARGRLAQAMGAEFQRDLLVSGLAPTEAEMQVNRSRQRILEAPACILLCQDTQVGDRYPDSTRQGHEALMGVQGVAMAGFACLLAAQAEGLAGVWVCAPLFAQAATRQVLVLPEAWQPQGLLLLGYPATIPAPRPRRDLAEVMVYR